MCGSPVLNEREELIGIHIGSFSKTQENEYSFVTPASYLKILVEAYHHGGQAAVPFYIDTKRWLHLNIDEYITYSALYNSFGKVEWEKNVSYRFSHRELQKALLEHPDATLLKIETQRIKWSAEETALLLFPKEAVSPSSVYLYDLQQNKLIRSSSLF